jgi:hypothetical protein
MQKTLMSRVSFFFIRLVSFALRGILYSGTNADVNGGAAGTKNKTTYSLHLFIDIAIQTAPCKQTKVLAKPSPVLIVQLKKLLS